MYRPFSVGADSCWSHDSSAPDRRVAARRLFRRRPRRLNRHPIPSRQTVPTPTRLRLRCLGFLIGQHRGWELWLRPTCLRRATAASLASGPLPDRSRAIPDGHLPAPPETLLQSWHFYPVPGAFPPSYQPTSKSPDELPAVFSKIRRRRDIGFQLRQTAFLQPTTIQNRSASS